MAAAAAIATASMLTVKPPSSIPIKSASSPVINHSKPKPISLLSLHSLPPKVLSAAVPSSLTAAGAFFSALASADPAIAAHQISEIADAAASDDNRGLILLLPIVPAIGWVLFNILQPALNQLNRMRSSSSKGVIIGLGLGLGGVSAAAQFLHPYAASAASADLTGTAAEDNRALLLLVVVAPALLWVAYNILQPALNQINRMRSG